MHTIGGRERELYQRIAAIQQRTQDAACPIYGTAARDGHLVGSGFLLEVHGVTLLLITAAHVLEEKRRYVLCLPGENTILPFEGTAFTTRVYDAKLKQDIAFVVLNSESADSVRGCRSLRPQDLDVNDVGDSQTLYGFTGFPGSKNKPRPGRVFRPSSAIYTSTVVPTQVYSKVGYDVRSHLTVEFDRERMLNRELRLVTAPDPHGVSGGPVWRLGALPDIEAGTSKERVVALAVEWRKDFGVLVAVRISLLVECIRACLTELVSALPTTEHLRANVSVPAAKPAAAADPEKRFG